MKLAFIDLTVVALYVIVLVSIALWVSRGAKKNAQDYFLAGNSLPWWAIGSSLIAANISAEQIIGMSGSGFAMGMAIASYEWMAAITLILVGKYLLPIFLARKIYTMPQFLEQRYDHRVRSTLAVFWLGVYTFVNLTSILWLGALAMNTVAGVPMTAAMIFLGLFSVTYSLYGGLKAVAFTDIIQIAVLGLGGMLLVWVTLNAVSDQAGALVGFQMLLERVPEKFDMIFSSDHPHYDKLPGITVLIGGMWIMNLSYWGFNQYIIQRALAAKSLREAQKGIILAAFIKILMPIIVVLPGVTAAVLAPNLDPSDQAYPEMMTLMPVGFKGLVFAALIAAIVSSLSSMTNSISTIFTMDIYQKIRPHLDPKHYVLIGRVAALGSLIVAMICAQPLLGNFDQAFQYIQEFTGFFTPGIVSIFLLGMFWRGMTASAALTAAISSALLSLALRMWWPELPFLDRVGLVFLSCCALGWAVSAFQHRYQAVEASAALSKAVDLKGVDFHTVQSFNYSALAVTLILAALYVIWW